VSKTTTFYTVPTIAELKALTTRPAVVELTGIAAGIFNWYAADATTADDGTVVQCTSGPVGRYIRVYNGPLDVRWFGATGDGSTDDTTALQAALNALGTIRGLYFPSGTYLTKPLTISGVTGFYLIGPDFDQTKLLLTQAGTLLTITGPCNFSRIAGLTFGINGTPQSIGSTNGIEIVGSGATGNIKLDRVIVRGFAVDGIKLTGNITDQMTGNDITNSYVLGCGGKAVNSVYNHDFLIGGNQFGIEGGFPAGTHGLYLTNSDSGVVRDNKIWSLQLGIYATTSSYNSWQGNRITQSARENVTFLSSFYTDFIGNKVYSGSQDGNGLYSNVIVDTCINFLFEGNQVFTWDATNSKYGLEVKNGCQQLTIKGNRVRGFDATKGPYSIDSATAVAGFAVDRVVAAGSRTSIAAGVTSYVGSTGVFDGAIVGAILWYINGQEAIMGAQFGTTAVAGIGESYTYTIQKSFSDTSMVGVISGGTDAFVVLTTPTLQILADTGDALSIKVVTTGGAAVVGHFYKIMLADY
jgi:parallel beta-helix repeat protein